jgi:formylglycine-generating enzyme required for sulfatase activity
MTTVADTMVRIPGGEFAMGSDDHYPDEGPVRRVSVDAFWIDPHPVTNTEFAAFVAATGYRTVAEHAPDPRLYPGADPADLVPGAVVFRPTDGPVDLRDYSAWWHWTPGADWRHPLGPGSDLAGLGEHPAVHVAYPDAAEYAAWAGKELPTEAEWEYAARGGLDGAEFAWGDDNPQEDGDPLANTWQGRFPYQNTELDGWTRTSPVGSYPPNGYGLHDMIGNVWEWTDDWYSRTRPETEASCCGPGRELRPSMERSLDPAQPHTPIPRKVVKGGSHLCTIQYCYRYRPAARQPQTIDTGMSHLGFRCVVRNGDT